MDPMIEPITNLERPLQATRAVQLLFASLAIGMLRAIFGLTQRVSGAALILAALIVIAVFAILFFLVWKISAGRNWARIILLVLVIINLPFAVMANVGELKQSLHSGALSIFIETLLWIGTYLLFTKNSNQWFRKLK
ncbi:MAG: hypothetical protein ABJC10_14275 [Acidobacteriota bacterium]